MELFFTSNDFKYIFVILVCIINFVCLPWRIKDFYKATKYEEFAEVKESLSSMIWAAIAIILTMFAMYLTNAT